MRAAPRLVHVLGRLVAAIVVVSAPTARAENPPSAGSSAPAQSSAPRGAPAAKNIPLDGQIFPPGPIVVSQIHNAPGWQPSRAYSYASGPATRVVNGPGWSPTDRRYNPGQRLDAFQLVSTGTCTSAPGGGPGGTGASIADGTCTWKYLSGVDYISITGWTFDNRRWKAGTAYNFLDYVTIGSPLRTYALGGERCVSKVAPMGTGSDTKSLIATNDGCQWYYQADVIYTSERSFIPTETFTAVEGPATLMLQANYEAQIWNDREYVAGQNGEATPIRTQGHDDFRREGGIILGCTTSPCHHLIVTTAPGESFRDSLTPSDPLAGYDPSKGVAIRNSLPYLWPSDPAGFEVHDNHVDFFGLQVRSVHGAAINGMSTYGNVMTIRSCILDGGSNDEWTARAAATTDTNSVIANSLIISHAPIGVLLKYPGFVLHSTIVNPDRTPHSVGIETHYKWAFNDTTVSNTAIFGFTHAAGHHLADTSWAAQSSHNMTDAPPGDAGTVPWPYGGPDATTIDRLPGTTYGVPTAQAFAKQGSDWRPANASPLSGAGSAFGTFQINCEAAHPSCPDRATYNFDTPNIIGTPRPRAGHHDIGAW